MAEEFIPADSCLIFFFPSRSSFINKTSHHDILALVITINWTEISVIKVSFSYTNAQYMHELLSDYSLSFYYMIYSLPTSYIFSRLLPLSDVIFVFLWMIFCLLRDMWHNSCDFSSCSCCFSVLFSCLKLCFYFLFLRFIKNLSFVFVFHRQENYTKGRK